MNHTQTVLLSILLAMMTSLLALAATSVISPARSAVPVPVAMTAADTPLIVIRFNQRRVYYEQPLFTAVSRAVEVKPDVRFHLVAFVPATGDSAKDKSMMAQSSRHLSDITQALISMGIPQPQITASSELASGLNHDEVHIFVQ